MVAKRLRRKRRLMDAGPGLNHEPKIRKIRKRRKRDQTQESSKRFQNL